MFGLLSAFEATILGFLSVNPSSRYEVMKAVQNQSLYWTGSPGAVYSALERLEKKGMIEETESTGTKIYKATEQGLYSLNLFATEIVNAFKLVLDPVLLRIKLRISLILDPSERVKVYERQLAEFPKAEEFILERRTGNIGRKISQDISDLAIEQLKLEANLIQKLVDEINEGLQSEQ